MTRPHDENATDLLRDVKRRRQERKEKKEDLEAHTVESYLTMKRDEIVAEIDSLTGKLVEESHDAGGRRGGLCCLVARLEGRNCLGARPRHVSRE